MRWGLICLLIWMVFLSQSYGISVNNDSLSKENKQKITKNIIMIVTKGTHQKHLGSGVLLGDGFGVTNLHVIGKDSKRVWLTFWDNEIQSQDSARFCVISNIENDLCIFRVNYEAKKLNLVIDPEDHHYFTIGNPNGKINTWGNAWDLSYLVYRVNSINSTPTSQVLREVIQFSCDHVAHGSSGGALVDRDGALLGIVSAKNNANHQCVAIPAAIVRDEVQNAKKS